MNDELETFRAFEQSGWQDPNLCGQYHAHLSAVTRQSVDALLDASGALAGSGFLDVATGAGYVAGAAAARGAHATGLDFSSEQIELARRHYPGVTFQVGEADQLPFADASFDCIVSAFGMPHFPDPDRALGQMYRTLKRNGRVAFTVWDIPDRAVGFGAVYAAIRAHGSLDVGLPAGPSFFLFSDPGECMRALLKAGFVSPTVITVPQLWSLQRADDAFDTIMQSTVRASATLRAQTPAALDAIRQALRDGMQKYRQGERYIVPMPAVLASAIKPG